MQDLHHIIAACTNVIPRRMFEALPLFHLSMASLRSPIWRAIESFYESFAPNPTPRIRDPSKPMQVICVGLPRSGTESLQKALLTLGYDYTYHVRMGLPLHGYTDSDIDVGVGHAE
jgi:hypothetical protein